MTESSETLDFAAFARDLRVFFESGSHTESHSMMCLVALDRPGAPFKVTLSFARFDRDYIGTGTHPSIARALELAESHLIADQDYNETTQPSGYAPVRAMAPHTEPSWLRRVWSWLRRRS